VRSRRESDGYTDMTFDATELGQRFPDIHLATVAEVARREYARLQAGEGVGS